MKDTDFKLTPDEMVLLSAFRALPDKQKKRAVVYMQLCAKDFGTFKKPALRLVVTKAREGAANA